MKCSCGGKCGGKCGGMKRHNGAVSPLDEAMRGGRKKYPTELEYATMPKKKKSEKK